ncbi:hypothetical protein [Brevibacillus gelatini]|uniref:hypothetical protein n=1 Tax=Brevibacillus gelatini TaxID=1655277 RepID=UPI003D8171B8
MREGARYSTWVVRSGALLFSNAKEASHGEEILDLWSGKMKEVVLISTLNVSHFTKRADYPYPAPLPKESDLDEGIKAIGNNPSSRNNLIIPDPKFRTFFRTHNTGDFKSISRTVCNDPSLRYDLIVPNPHF